MLTRRGASGAGDVRGPSESVVEPSSSEAARSDLTDALRSVQAGNAPDPCRTDDEQGGHEDDDDDRRPAGIDVDRSDALDEADDDSTDGGAAEAPESSDRHGGERVERQLLGGRRRSREHRHDQP